MPTTQRYGVIVVGGGSAGISAAVQAGRAGSRTLLIEKNSVLGGTTTSGGVNFPGLFHAWGRQVIGGIGFELVRRCLAETGQKMPPFEDTSLRHHQHHVIVDRAVYTLLCDEALVDAGVEPLFHCLVASVVCDADGWTLGVCTKTGLSSLRATILIDCTGDANIVSLAGHQVSEAEDHQPATYCCRVSGYDLKQLDIAAINRAMAAEIAAGRLAATDAGWNRDHPDITNWLRKAGENANHIHHMPARSSVDKTRLDLAGRQSLLRMYRFLRTQPGLEQLRFDYLAAECGVRETAIIVGQGKVTVEDYCGGRRWHDAVCNSFYPIDLHTSTAGGLHVQPLKPGVVPTIPRSAMLPAGSRNLLVAGRCISSDRLANSALRVQATCMATGQAAGAMAALSARMGCAPEQLPIRKVHELLAAHGAILPGGELPATASETAAHV